MSRRLKNPRHRGTDPSVTSKLILDAYIHLCLDIGPAKITLETIAEKAKVALGTVRYHFAASEKDIVQQAILYVLEQGYKFLDDGIYKERLIKNFNPVHAYIKVMYQWIKDQPQNASFLVYYYYLSTTKTKLAVANETFLQRARMRISSFLLEAVGNGFYTRPKNPYLVAAEIHTILLGGWIAAIQGGTDKILVLNLENTLKLIDLRLMGKQ